VRELGLEGILYDGNVIRLILLAGSRGVVGSI